MSPVICGVDGSDSTSGSAPASRLARQLARQFRRPIVFVTVVGDETDEPTREAAVAVLSQHTAETPSDIDASWTIEDGHPADRLIALASEREASFLVVGNHGPRSSLLGSISADVSRRAPCPVVVVPQTAESAEDERLDADLEAHGASTRSGLASKAS